MSITVLAVDIGTSSIKTGIISRKGELKSWSRAAYTECSDSKEGWNTSLWPETLLKAVSRLDSLNKISAVAVSGNGPTVVPLDKNGRFLNDPYIWSDRRKNFNFHLPSFYIPSVLWMKENSPRYYNDSSLFLTIESFIPYLLTGKAVIPLPNKEFQKYIWDNDQIAEAGLDLSKFPPFLETGAVIGNTQGSFIRKLGIREGVPVFAGGSDYLMALLGAGAVETGTVCDRAGTSEGINYCSSDKSEYPGLRCLPHIIKGKYNVSAILTSSGRIFEWFRKISGQEKTGYQELLAEIQKVVLSDSDLYFFPSLKKGAVWDFSGGAMIGLEPEHGMPEAGSAVVKSIGFAVRNMIEVMENAGFNIDNIRVSGGQARNPLWNQMKSDMTGKTILVPEIFDGELLGCACSAFKGLGEFADLKEASKVLVRLKDEYRPDMHLFDEYSKLYRRYSEINNRITDLFDSISVR